jgi:hypothetical protein
MDIPPPGVDRVGGRGSAVWWPGVFAGQLAAGGVDLLPPALPDKHRIIGFPQDILNSSVRAAGGGS